MEDKLKVLKVEYISNQRSDHTHVLNSTSRWPSQMKITSNEDNLKISKVEYLLPKFET